MKVKFITGYRKKVGNPVTGKMDTDAKPESFEKDQVVDFAELRGNAEAGRRSAQHYINRGVAVKLDSPEAKQYAAKEKEAEKQEAERHAEEKKSEATKQQHNDPRRFQGK